MKKKPTENEFEGHPLDENNVPMRPRFLLISRTMWMVLLTGVVWVATKLIWQLAGDPIWHVGDGTIFFATALSGVIGFFSEVFIRRIWPVSTSAVLCIVYYLAFALSGAAVAYLF